MTVISSEEGSALTAVLVFVLVVSVSVGLILLVHVLQHRFVRRDVHRLQARYAAEAGIYRALAAIDSLRNFQTVCETERVDQCSVRVDPFGGFARLRSVATVQGQTVGLGALAGMRPPAAFDRAVLLGDARSTLTLTGSTQVEGGLAVGRPGMDRRALGGEPFTGSVEGPVLPSKDLSLPPFDSTLYQRTARQADRLLRDLPRGEYVPERSDEAEIAPEDASSSVGNPTSDSAVSVPRTPLITTVRSVRSVEGDLTLTAADSAILEAPVLVAATGDLFLRGPLSISDGSLFLSGNTLSIEGRVRGGQGLFYGRDTLLVEDGQTMGQFLSRGPLITRGKTRLRYPSIVSVLRPLGRVRLRGRSQVEGLVLQPFQSFRREGIVREVLVGSGARIRGGLYSRTQTELWGTVDGSVLTNQFGFYRSPTHYVNWLKDATIRRSERPAEYVVPFGFGERTRPKVIRWSVLKAGGSGPIR